MKNEFITYEQSLELKELGFDEECLFAYYGKSDLSNFKESDYELCGDRHNSSFKEDGRVSAPLYQQVFRWFREKYNLRGFIGFRPNVKQFDCHVYDMSLSGKEYVKQRTHEEFQKNPKVGTYEEAELECIKELIKIVKQQKILNDGRTI
jgi:hypothetical protein